MNNNSHSATTTSGYSNGHAQLIHQVTAVYLGLLAVLGAVGNSFVVATVLRMPQIHRLTYILVANNSFIGLLNCLLTIPLHVTHMLLGHALWKGQGSVMCRAQAHLNFGLVLSTLTNSAAIAVCRYRTVVTTHNVSGRTQSRRKIVKLLFFIWALPVIVAFSGSPFLGYNSLLGDCFFLVTDHSFWYKTMALSTPALASTVCMLIAYTLIIKKVRDSHLKIASLCHKPASVTDNAAQLSKEERTVSESEAMAEKVNGKTRGQTPGQSPSNMGGIKVFTTLVSDEAITAPSTKYNDDVSTSFCWDQPQSSSYNTSTQEDGPSLTRSHLQPAQSRPSTNLTVAGPTHMKGMDTLSVPSRAPSSLSGKSEESANVRNDSSLSGWSFLSTTPSDTKSKSRRQFKKEVKLTVHLFLAFVLFCLLYLPLCLAHLVHTFHPLSKEAWVVCYTLALTFASNAWLVYALLNKDFRRAFRALLQGRRLF